MPDYLVWQYRDDNNCWHYVRHWLHRLFGVDINDIPEFGIHPDAKQEMTGAYSEVKKTFIESEPVEGAVACKFYGRVLFHVGLIIDGKVRHVGRKTGGVKSEPVEKFNRGGRTKYYVHRSL